MGNERLELKIHEALTQVNQSFWTLFNAFENAEVITNDPFFVHAEWLHHKRTLSVRMGQRTGHSTFAKELATKYDAFLLVMDHEYSAGKNVYTHSNLRELYHRFETPEIPSLYIIDDAYQFGGRIESLVTRLIKFREKLGDDYLKSIRFVLLN